MAKKFGYALRMYAPGAIIGENKELYHVKPYQYSLDE